MDRIRQVTDEQAEKIIGTRKPLGRFWRQDGQVYVGIDNSTGDAWTEDFKTFEECMKWLKREV